MYKIEVLDRINRFWSVHIQPGRFWHYCYRGFKSGPATFDQFSHASESVITCPTILTCRLHELLSFPYIPILFNVQQTLITYCYVIARLLVYQSPQSHLLVHLTRYNT